MTPNRPLHRPIPPGAPRGSVEVHRRRVATALLALPLLAALLVVTACSRQALGPSPVEPAGTPGRGVVEEIHGVRVADPHRWLERLGSPAVERWVREHDAAARRFTDASPLLEPLRARLEETASLVRYGVPQVQGGRLFYLERGGDRTTPALLAATSSGEAPEPARVLLDPVEERLAGGSGEAGGSPERLRLGGFTPSPDGRLVAYALGPVSSRSHVLRVRRVAEDGASAGDLEHEIPGIYSGYYGVAWLPDSSGFLYSRFPGLAGADPGAPVGIGEVRLHRLGEDPADDPLVHRAESAEWVYLPSVPAAGGHLVLTGNRRNENRILWARLPAAGDERWEGLGERMRDLPATGSTSLLDARGDTLWLRTDVGAPRGRIVAVDTSVPGGFEPDAWREVVPESGEQLSRAAVVAGRILALYLHDARAALRVFELDGGGGRGVAMPSLGWVSALSGPVRGDHAYFGISGPTDPGTVYRLPLGEPGGGPGAGGEPLVPRVFLRGELPFVPEDYVTRQVFFASFDGTRVPMFLVHRRDVDPGAVPRPAWLYGYGAFGWAAVPWFQPDVLAWLDLGGVYALANVRGGGEYGRDWYEAGVGRDKQTSIDDYLAAAEHLVETGVTTSDLLVANGGSASGPLVGAALTQRPELFAAALVDIPVLDMLRFHLAPNGRRWVPEFGDPADRDDFRALHAYSPYHRVEPGVCYPAVLVTAGEKDEAAPPYHAYKLVAALEAATGCDRPALVQVARGAGHSFGADPAASRDNRARRVAFLARALGLEPRGEPGGGR